MILKSTEGKIMVEDSSKKRGSDEARAWANILSRHFGEAVHFHRNRLQLSAVQLSNRTKEIGYPITRGTIAKIEGNHRNGKMDVAEVLTLAAALEISPVDLIFPRYPSFGTQATPRFLTTAAEAQAWMSASPEYQPFGKAHSPRAEISQALRIRTDRLLEEIARVERKLQFGDYGIPIPQSITRDEARAILTDLDTAKYEIQKMGGSFAGTPWDHHLREFLEDQTTEWLPF